MNLAHQPAALALPFLSTAIPMVVHVPAGNQLAGPLALALLEANVITDKMLAPPNNPLRVVLGGPDEAELAAEGLSAWWAGLQAANPTKYFRWEMHVQQFEHAPVSAKDLDKPIGWFCLTRTQGVMPSFTLGERIAQLESAQEGFGQTVLAVLYDALRLLPHSLTPYQAYDWAEWLQWDGAQDDFQLLEQIREDREEQGYAPDEINTSDVFTRAQFFAGMPTWVAQPQRVVSRDDLVLFATSEFERDVIAACDALLDTVTVKKFRLKPYGAGPGSAGLDPLDGCILLLWREYDGIGRALDDAINYFMECDSTEMIDTHSVVLTSANFKNYQLRMEQMLRVGAAVERLVDLVGVPT